jgi:hypothetical protein
MGTRFPGLPQRLHSMQPTGPLPDHKLVTGAVTNFAKNGNH